MKHCSYFVLLPIMALGALVIKITKVEKIIFAQEIKFAAPISSYLEHLKEMKCRG
jgi:hypothetical protein